MLPAALLLDLDGTLVDSEAFHAEGIARYMAERGHVLTDEEKWEAVNKIMKAYDIVKNRTKEAEKQN